MDVQESKGSEIKDLVPKTINASSTEIIDAEIDDSVETIESSEVSSISSLEGPEEDSHKKDFPLYMAIVAKFIFLSCFFFVPGVTITYLINHIGPLPTSVAWVTSALFSAGIWFMLKLKFHGWVKPTKWYLCICTIVILILLLLIILTDIQVVRGSKGILQMLFV